MVGDGRKGVISSLVGGVPLVDGGETKDKRKLPLMLEDPPETPGGKHLEKFTLVSQKPQSNWCWAANSDAVSNFYGNRIDKCKVVTRVLRDKKCYWKDAFKQMPKKDDGSDDQCCRDKWPLTGTTDPCTKDGQVRNGNTDRRGRVVCGLLAVMHYRGFKTMKSDPFDIAKVSEQINDEQPLIMQVQWDGGGQHYVAIAGYDDKHNLSIADPMSDSMAQKDGHWSTMHIGDDGDQYYAPEGGWGTWIATGKTVKKQG